MSQTQPSSLDIQQMWQELVVTADETALPGVGALADEFRLTHDNGGAEFAAFTYEAHPVFDWFVQRGRLPPPHFDLAGGFLTLPAVRHAVQTLTTPVELTTPLVADPLDIFDLEADLTRKLVTGGAYTRFAGSRQDAQAIVAGFTTALAPDPQDARSAGFWQPWTPWFCDVAWDMTWVAVQRSQRRCWLLCVTDTD